MAASSVIKTKFDGGTVKLEDGTGTPLSNTVRFDKADTKISGLRHGSRRVIPIKGRGKTRSLRQGDVEYPQITFSVQVADLSESSGGTILDWCYKQAPYGSRVTTIAIGDADTMDITFTQEGTTYGDSADQTIKVEDVGDWVVGFAEGDENTVEFEGTVFGDVYINGTKFLTAPRAS